MSLRQVRKPHMKNKVVTTISGTAYEEEPLGEETVVEALFGVAIAINPYPPLTSVG
jgi:hypothetical protein